MRVQGDAGVRLLECTNPARRELQGRVGADADAGNDSDTAPPEEQDDPAEDLAVPMGRGHAEQSEKERATVGRGIFEEI